MSMERADAERAINALLAQHWDPLLSHDAASYQHVGHEVYALLARGASDVQVGRYLHQVEREEMKHPDADERDLGAVLRLLRGVEREM